MASVTVRRAVIAVHRRAFRALLQSYNRLMVAEHGRLAGRDAMMAEIQSRGPISCGIDATLKLDGYEGGCPFLDTAGVRTASMG